MAESDVPFRSGVWELSLAIACVLSLVFFPPALVVCVPTLIGVVLWRGWRVGRPEKPRACVRCGYVLRDLKGTICPECGAKFLNPEAERARILREREGRGKQE